MARLLTLAGVVRVLVLAGELIAAIFGIAVVAVVAVVVALGAGVVGLLALLGLAFFGGGVDG